MKIGVFDSGIGGLVVLKKLIKENPNNFYVYLGDNQNAPYGDKSVEELTHLVDLNVKILLSYGVECVVIACNTVSTTLLNYLKSKYKHIKFYGVFPYVDKNLFIGGNCDIFCTSRTYINLTNNGFYKKYKSQIRLISCPGLVEKIETNFPLFYREIISEYIPQNLEKTNQVVLGCTHYEFLSSVFKSYYPNAVFINTAKNFLNKIPKFVNRDIGLKFIGACADKNLATFNSF